MRLGVILVSISAVAAYAADGLADPAEAGRQHYQACAACHGQQGEGIQALDGPRIAGLGEWYLVRQLINYRDGPRGSHPEDVHGAQMRTMAMVLPNDRAVADVVAYIATLEAPAPEPTVQGNAERGGNLYAAECAACHGDNAEGNRSATAPRLAGQSDWYLVRQLEKFKAGHRGGIDDVYGAAMRPLALLLIDDQDVRDVVAYINSLENAGD